MSTRPHHPLVIRFLEHLHARGKSSTADSYDQVLGKLSLWLAAENLDPVSVGTADLERFQEAVAAHRTAVGTPLAASTQACITAVMGSLFGWLYRRGHIPSDPSAGLAVPRVLQRGTVAKDHLSLDECLLVLETLRDRVRDANPGSAAHAVAQRNLALIALALASGMRCHTLLGLRPDQVMTDPTPSVRIETAKGKAGRVIPTALWAVAAVRTYAQDGRVRLLKGATSDRLFVSQRRGFLGHKAYSTLLEDAVRLTVERHHGCPSVADLAEKRITTHALRVTTARSLLYDGGCDIRSIGELLLHGAAGAPTLSTTGRYVPVSAHDLARALRGAHPRW